MKHAVAFRDSLESASRPLLSRSVAHRTRSRGSGCLASIDRLRAIVLGLVLGAAPSALGQNSVLALYTFDKGTLADVSGNNIAASSILGVPTFGQPGFEGEGVTPNGVLRINLDINPATHPQLTMGGWVRPISSTTIQTFLSHDNAGFDRTLTIEGRSGTFGWSCFNGSGVLGALPVVTNQWQFVAGSYDHTAGTVTFYVDGQVLTSADHTGTGNSFVYVGRNPCCGNVNIADYAVDNIFFMSEALSTARLDEIRSGGYHKIPTCPLFIKQPSALHLCPGGTAVFMVDAAGSGTVTLQWRKAGVPLANGPRISGVTISTLTITNVGSTDAALYDCVATNACGSASSVQVSVAVCKADFNCSGSVSVQDLFDYLAAWFAQSPTADLNGSGTITVQDLFDFLAAWFQGC